MVHPSTENVPMTFGRGKQESARKQYNGEKTESKNGLTKSSSVKKSCDVSDVSSMSSVESIRGRSRERNRSSDFLDGSLKESSYSWRKNFDKSLEKEDRVLKKVSNDQTGTSNNTRSKEYPNRRLSNIVECINQQSPSMSILQIKLDGETRLQSSKAQDLPIIREINKNPTINTKDIEKSTCDVDIHVKREIFEGKLKDGVNKTRDKKYKADALFESPSKSKSVKENWNSIREKHCPITSGIVNDDKGESLRSSLLGSDKKISFKNLKFSKHSSDEASVKSSKTGEISSTKEFEDRATGILNEMRKQRRTLQMEYVAKVSVPTTKNVTG